MKGWILYQKTEADLKQGDYGVNRLMAAAKEKGVELNVYRPDQFDLVVTRADRKSILMSGQPVPLPDFIIPRMGSNTTYFALAVIRQLERLGVYSFNSSLAVETVKDKLHMHQILAYNKLPTPKTMLVRFPVTLETIQREIGFPCIIKNITGTEGNGIYLCEQASKFEDLMELVYTNNAKANLIVQEFIAESKGKDLRVFVVGGKVIGCMKRYSETSFKANFSRGGKTAEFEVTPEIEQLAVATANLVKLDITGIDLLFSNDGFKVCEANSAPGFKGLEQVMGEVIAEKIMDYIVEKIGSIKKDAK